MADMERTIPVRLDRDMVSEVDRLAAEEDRNRSNMIRVLLKEALEARRAAER